MSTFFCHTNFAKSISQITEKVVPLIPFQEERQLWEKLKKTETEMGTKKIPTDPNDPYFLKNCFVCQGPML